MTVCTSGLGRVRRAGEGWPGSRSSSSPISGSQRGISLFSNTACSMLLPLLPATRCNKCDTSHGLLSKTRSGVSSHEEQAMLCHPAKPSLCPDGQQQTEAMNTPTFCMAAGPGTQQHTLPHTHMLGWTARPPQGQKKTLNSSLHS